MTIATTVHRSGLPSNGKMAIPAYQKIQSSIRERIEAGRSKSGDTVASEHELARLHGVSLMTGAIDFAVRFCHPIRCRIAVYIHRCSKIGVSDQLLLYAHWTADRILPAPGFGGPVY